MHFQVCSHLKLDKSKLNIPEVPGHSVVPNPPRGSNHPMRNGRVVHDRLHCNEYSHYRTVSPLSKPPSGNRYIANRGP